jgi:glutathione S-transferase
MRLFHSPRTRSSRVLWALEEAGLPYEVVRLSREERRQDDHRALHPLGRVPVLEDEQGPIFESTGLLFHVGELAPSSGLMPPAGSHERAIVYQWTLFAVSELEPYCAALGGVAKDDPAGDPVRAEAQPVVGVLEARLTGRELIAGDAFTVADIATAAVLRWARSNGIVTRDDRAINEYLERTLSRPAAVVAYEA